MEALKELRAPARPARTSHTEGEIRRRSSHPASALAPLSESAFRAVLSSEQACLERYARPFSLIRFDTPLHAGDTEHFARRAGSLLRSTDLVGLFGAGRVMVLLPLARQERAREVAELLVREQGRARSRITYTIEVHGHVADMPRAFEGLPRTETRNATALPPGIRWEQRGMTCLLGTPLPRWKRALDIALALTGLILLSPLMLLIAAVIQVGYGSPVIYRQWRTGKGFRRFQLCKFRTMRPNSAPGWEDVQHLNEMSGPLFKSSRDPRILAFGKLLRKTSLDELPQLVNVLAGHMTLVGPRALSPQPDAYQTWQLRRFDVTAGLACEWQAERRNGTAFDEWMRSDLRYVDRGQTLTGDVRLLFRTVLAVLRCEGSR